MDGLDSASTGSHWGHVGDEVGVTFSPFSLFHFNPSASDGGFFTHFFCCGGGGDDDE